MSKRKNNVLLTLTGNVRRVLTLKEIKRETRENSKTNRLDVGTTKKLEIIPLFEALSLEGLQSGFGVSYLIRTDDATILFDVGNNPSNLSPSPLEENMMKLGVTLEMIDYIVISHRHPDHVGGMKWWEKKSFSLNGITQQNLGDVPVYATEKLRYPNTTTHVVKAPVRFSTGVATTGRFTFFESYPQWKINPDDSEQSLVVHVEGKGLVVIVGCGHMGLGTLLNRLQSVFPQPIVGIMGGLHYGKACEHDLHGDLHLMDSLDLESIALSSHDSYPEAIKVVEERFKERFNSIRVGEPLQYGH